MKMSSKRRSIVGFSVWLALGCGIAIGLGSLSWVLYRLARHDIPTEALVTSQSDQEHIRQVILSLPTDSEMRSYLERGDRGDGVHYPWMDQMKKLGVKRARVFLDFTWSAWRRHPVDIGLSRIALYKSYDGNCAQITDPEQRRLIENAGLRRELERFAAAETAKSHWFYIDKRPLANHGLAAVELFDDEWLPRFSPNLMTLGGGDKQPPILIDGDIFHLQDALKNKQFSQDDLDDALFEVSGYLDDSCSITPLLSAGANPNSRNTDGENTIDASRLCRTSSRCGGAAYWRGTC
jgi:hypothetical protein